MMKARMKRGLSIGAPIFVSLCLVGLFVVLLNGKHIAVLTPAGEVAAAERNVLMFALFLSAVVVIPVFTMLIYFSLKYRASNTRAKYSPEWGANKWLESLWWGIPIFIIGILGVVTVQTSHSLDPYKALSGNDSLQVKVVALRWKWLFIYPEQGIATLNQLPLPLDRPVTFTLTADAPMSSFWIPDLGSQVYAMNGMASTLNLKATKIGTYTGYSTNINGEGYAKMKFAAKVMPSEGFDKWAASAFDSKNTMDMTEYDQLAKPLSDTSQKSYHLSDQKLFDQILKKYTKDGGHTMDMSGMAS